MIGSGKHRSFQDLARPAGKKGKSLKIPPLEMRRTAYEAIYQKDAKRQAHKNESNTQK
jgi:hypothetical protein